MSEIKNKKNIIKYKIIIEYNYKSKKKTNPCNQINKHINKYNPKNKNFYYPNSNNYINDLNYLTNSDIYYSTNKNY